MENLKIKNTKTNEILKNLTELGYVWYPITHDPYDCLLKSIWIITESNGEIFYSSKDHFRDEEEFKEITIEQLRDMVVLKRNSVEDANYELYGNKYYLTSDGRNHCLNKVAENGIPIFKWVHCGVPLSEEFKPIRKEKTMKEWIYKDGSGKYVLTTDPEVANLASDAVEVPDGAETFNYFGDEGNQFFLMCSGDKVLFAYASDLAWREWGDESFDGVICLWQREKPQEKCADVCGDVVKVEMCEGGSKPKHSHYKKNVAHLNVIDPYRIADLYDLHPCAEHIMKKSLCAGGRGHKDLLRDIQDIIDTAERWKEMIEEDER